MALGIVWFVRPRGFAAAGVTGKPTRRAYEGLIGSTQEVTLEFARFCKGLLVRSEAEASATARRDSPSALREEQRYRVPTNTGP